MRSCARVRGTGWQGAGGEQPISRESLVVSRPLGPAVAAAGAQVQRQDDKVGGRAPAFSSGLLVLQDSKGTSGRTCSPARIPALPGLDEGRRPSRPEGPASS